MISRYSCANRSRAALSPSRPTPAGRTGRRARPCPRRRGPAPRSAISGAGLRVDGAAVRAGLQVRHRAAARSRLIGHPERCARRASARRTPEQRRRRQRRAVALRTNRPRPSTGAWSRTPWASIRGSSSSRRSSARGGSSGSLDSASSRSCSTDPGLRVGGVEDLVQPDAERHEDPERQERAGDDRCAVAEQPVGIHHHRAAGQFDVGGRSERAGPEQHPHRIELLKHQP